MVEQQESDTEPSTPAVPLDFPLVDLHTHILPGIDDGARDEAQSLAMLRVAEEDGIGTVAATPHDHHIRQADVPAGVARLNALAEFNGLNVRVVPGSEVRIGTRAPERHLEGQLLTLNGTSYFLWELFFHDEWPRDLVERAAGRLLDVGLRPILTHAERYGFVQRDRGQVTWLIEHGVLIQINAPSLFGYHGQSAQRTAEALIRDGHAHLLASDAHNHERRAPRVRGALERAAKLRSPDYARWMAEAARTIVTGGDVHPPG